MQNIFAERLKMLRLEYGLSQSMLADCIGVTRQAIGNYENGKRECGFDVLMMLAEMFGVTTDFLIGYSDKRKDE
ncbi:MULTISPECIES: helix-turn-helix transcriptional regulator [Mediterraneibacter]|uniref:helix-turn-helix transcriptional regulator n=1 Tax=Mediterraneibacter TaxID=2316020 RepID=UPI0022E3B751|nr:helix-turn-helix transcriptional regulator [Mediterraneibacter massiliensis]